MGNIVPLPTTHISLEKGGGLIQESGYNQIPEAVVAGFFEYLRGGGGPDAFIIKLYYPNTFNYVGPTLMHGCVPPEENTDIPRIRKIQRNLESEMDAKAPDAFREIKQRTSRVFRDRHHENNMVFAMSSKGLISCGWHDSANSREKGLLMASYMLYAFGALNKKNDPILYDAVYRYLPFDGVFSRSDAKEAERIITGCLGRKFIAEN